MKFNMFRCNSMIPFLVLLTLCINISGMKNEKCVMTEKNGFYYSSKLSNSSAKLVKTYEIDSREECRDACCDLQECNFMMFTTMLKMAKDRDYASNVTCFLFNCPDILKCITVKVPNDTGVSIIEVKRENFLFDDQSTNEHKHITSFHPSKSGSFSYISSPNHGDKETNHFPILMLHTSTGASQYETPSSKNFNPIASFHEVFRSIFSPRNSLVSSSVLNNVTVSAILPTSTSSLPAGTVSNYAISTFVNTFLTTHMTPSTIVMPTQGHQLVWNSLSLNHVGQLSGSSTPLTLNTNRSSIQSTTPGQFATKSTNLPELRSSSVLKSTTDSKTFLHGSQSLVHGVHNIKSPFSEKRNHTTHVSLIISLFIGIVFFVAVVVLISRRWSERFSRRAYNRVDFLLNDYD